MIKDQAQRLREYLQQHKPEEKPEGKATRVIAVTSGKGGVGKSNVTINFALSLMQKGQKVVVIDLDLGMANIDILLGLAPKHNLIHMIDGELSIFDVMEKGPNGLEYIAGGSGFQEILQLDEARLRQFFQQFAKLHGYADTILLDTGAGISQESLRFILAADEVFLVTTPEPTAITDAYSMLKILHAKDAEIQVRMIINRVQSFREGKIVANKIKTVAEQFLSMQVGYLGYLEEDPQVMQAVKKQMPYLLAFPNSTATLGMRELTAAFLAGGEMSEKHGGMKGFIHKLVKMVKH